MLIYVFIIITIFYSILFFRSRNGIWCKEKHYLLTLTRYLMHKILYKEMTVEITNYYY